jgi:hypothetical protein
MKYIIDTEEELQTRSGSDSSSYTAVKKSRNGVKFYLREQIEIMLDKAMRSNSPISLSTDFETFAEAKMLSNGLPDIYSLSVREEQSKKKRMR